MSRYEFNRNEFKWAEEFCDIIAKKMNLPEWFGKNLDALWDVLTGYIETPCQIILKGFDQKENAYNKQHISNIINCFKDAQDKFPESFDIIID